MGGRSCSKSTSAAGGTETKLDHGTPTPPPVENIKKYARTDNHSTPRHRALKRKTAPKKHWEQQADDVIISGCGWGRTYTNPSGSAAWAGCTMAGAASTNAATASAAGAGLGSPGASEVAPFTAEALRSFSASFCARSSKFAGGVRGSMYLTRTCTSSRLLRGRRLSRHCFRRRKMTPISLVNAVAALNDTDALDGII